MKRFKEEMGNFLKKIAVTITVTALLTGIITWTKRVNDYVFLNEI